MACIPSDWQTLRSKTYRWEFQNFLDGHAPLSTFITRTTPPHLTSPILKPRLWRTQPEIEKSDHTYPPKLARGPSENDVDNAPFGRISLKSRFFRIASKRDALPNWTKKIENAPWQALQNRKNRFSPNVMFHEKKNPRVEKIAVFWGLRLNETVQPLGAITQKMRHAKALQNRKNRFRPNVMFHQKKIQKWKKMRFF